MGFIYPNPNVMENCYFCGRIPVLHYESYTDGITIDGIPIHQCPDKLCGHRWLPSEVERKLNDMIAKKAMKENK